MSQAPVIFSVSQGVLTLTLNRPQQGNAFTPEMLLLMIDELQVSSRSMHK